MKNSKSVGIAIAVMLVLALTCGAHFASGQEVTGAITGAVTDPSGAPIAGASVTARDVVRNVSYPTQTNADGAYYLARIPVGNYELKFEAKGFATSVRPKFELVLNQTARVDVQMVVGAMTQSVEVSSEAPLLKTDSTQLDTVIDGSTNVALPLATRNYNQLTLLTPGAVSTNVGAFSGAQATFQVGRPYINGNREQTNNYILDGMDNNQIDNNDVAFAPSVDAIQEFNLISQNASAEFGNYIGGVIIVSTKSGGNQYHGNAFEFIRNDKLNANQWSNKINPTNQIPRALLRWNEFGASVGGPIKKDKLFFFADYQGSRFHQPSTTNPTNVYTTAERGGDFSVLCTSAFVPGSTTVHASFVGGLCNNPTNQLYNPFSSANPATRTPFLGNQIPTSMFSTAAKNILASSLYPTPINDLPTGNANNVVSQFTDSDQGDLKIDYVLSEKDRISGRYSQQYVQNPTINSLQLAGDSTNTFPLHNGVVDWTRVINPALVNDARFGVSYFPVTLGISNPTGQNLPQLFGIAGSPDTLLPQMNISNGLLGLSGNDGFGNNDAKNEFNDTVIEAQDSVTWTSGRHVRHFGFQVFRYRTNIFYPGNEGLAGQLFFTGQYTGNTAANPASIGSGDADFVLGLPTQVGLGAGTGARGLRNTIFGAFYQDDWRITNQLSVNLGLRWELVTPRGEVNNLQTNYDQVTGEIRLAGQGGNSSALINQYNGITNFQPRLGLAWSPSGKNTVVRAAYGVSSFSESTGTNNLLFQNPPFTIPHNVTYLSTTAQPGSTLDQGFSAFPASGCTVANVTSAPAACFAGSGIHAFDPDFRPAVSQQWNVSVQHQLGNSTTLQASYVGQRTQHLASISLINQLVLNPDGTTSPSPYFAGNPTLVNEVGQSRLSASNGYSNYNALQIVAQHRMHYGLQFQANYTWSKCLTNSSGFFAEFGDALNTPSQAGNNYFFFQNTYNPNADYGPCYSDLRHVFNGYVTYELPFGRGRMIGKDWKGVVNVLAGGWQINSIYTLHSGFPITAQGPNNSGVVTGFPRANCIASPRETSGTNVGAALGGGFAWLDATTVAPAAAGTFGTCGVGTFRGPALHNADLSISKFFTVTEHQNLEFRAEFINFTNTPILSAPNSGIGTTFGFIQTSQGARQIQFALKYSF